MGLVANKIIRDKIENFRNTKKYKNTNNTKKQNKNENIAKGTEDPTP